MKTANVTLIPMQNDDRNQFILDNQRAFKYGAVEEFGERDNHFEEEGEIISRRTIEESMDAEGAVTYRIVEDGQIVGGVILKIDVKNRRNELVLFFVAPEAHSRGIGTAAWREIEKLYPDTEVWETCTPYFEKRNIHFYINKCGFHAVEFFGSFHTDPHMPDNSSDNDCDDDCNDEMFIFEKIMKKQPQR